jgi:mRNA interferase MazF
VTVSRHDPDPPRALVLYVPLTTQNRRSRYEVALPKLPFLHQDSVANVQGLASIPSTYLERRLGRLSEPVMAEVKRALAFALDIG